MHLVPATCMQENSLAHLGRKNTTKEHGTVHEKHCTAHSAQPVCNTTKQYAKPLAGVNITFVWQPACSCSAGNNTAPDTRAIRIHQSKLVRQPEHGAPTRYQLKHSPSQNMVHPHAISSNTVPARTWCTHTLSAQTQSRLSQL
jgi:hypothetical protein